MADEPPKLSIAAEQSAADLAQQEAIDDLRWPIRDMAANLLRIARGAGKPYLLPQQILELAAAIEAAAKHPRIWRISETFEEVLQSGLPDWEDRENEWDEVRTTIIRGSLQYVASRLVHQNTQMAAGRSEIADGIRQIEARREREREKRELEWARERAAQLAERRAKRKPRKAKPKASVTNQLVAARPAPKPKAKPSTVEDERPTSTAEFMRRRTEELGS